MGTNPIIDSKRSNVDSSHIMRLDKCDAFLFVSGLVLVIALACYYVTMGENAVVLAHDQLDQMYAPLYVEHFMEPSAPEFMYGVETGSLLTTPIAFALLYFVLSPAYAYLMSYAIIMVIAYVGMILLCRHFQIRMGVAVLSGIAFALLPFYCTYGLSMMGIPLIATALLAFWRHPHKKQLVFLLVLSALFPLVSGLTLTGYILVGCYFLLILAALVKSRKKASRESIGRLKGFVLAGLLFLGVYLCLNVGLFVQAFSPSEKWESHRSEFTLSTYPATWQSVLSFLLNGQQHAVANQRYIAFPVYICAIMAFCSLAAGGITLCRKHAPLSEETVSLCKLLIILAASAALIAAFYVFFHSATITSLRSSWPSLLKTFQFDRFYLLYPTLWYLAFAASIECFMRVFPQTSLRVIGSVAFALVYVLTLKTTVPMNDIYQSFERQMQPDIPADFNNITWKEFFGESVFDQIEQAIPEIAETKTVSIGLFPSIALYNGLATADGYNANYPLEYKHRFREIIENDLAKDPDLKSYFDGWGSRCYVYVAELGNDRFVLKGSGRSLTDLDLNTEKLKEVGVGFILSALPIDSAEDKGLESRGRFSSDGVPYEVWVYQVA